LIESRRSVDTHGEVIITFAGFVRPGIVVGGHVPVAAQQIVDMIAVFGSIRANASTEAEFGIGDERGPFVVLKVGAECVSVHQTTNGVAISICSVRVELTSSIAFAYVDLGEITNAGDLHVIGGLYKVDTLEGAIGNCTSAPAGFSAPSNFFTFRVADGTNTRGSPETEIIDVVDPGSLTIRALAGCGAAVVGTGLAILRLVGRICSRVSDIPDLVRVATRALPNLQDIAISCGAAREIGAFAVISPGKMIVGGIVPLLVFIFARGITGPNLEFSAGYVGTVLYVEAFGAKDLNLTILEAPLLRGGTSTTLDGHGSTVGIGRRGHALSIVKARLNEYRGELCRSLSGGEGGKCNGDDSDGRGNHG